MRGGGGGFRGGGIVRGGGGGGFRSGIVGGGFRGGFAGGSFRGNLGFVSRPFSFTHNRFFFGSSRFHFPGNRFYFGFGGFWGYPDWGYPYSYGPAYYPYPYSYPYAYDYGYPPASAPPPVVIEQHYAPAPRSESGAPFYREADYYLIAFNDHTIRAALAFWVEGDQIHWITREHEQKHAPLSSVDRRFSEQINRDRRVEFRLP